MGIKVDTSQLANFSTKIKSLNSVQKETFFQTAAADLANRLLALAIPRTPVDTGVLRNGWTQNGGVGRLGVQRTGEGYSITVVNDTPYASYVEYGHRQEPGRYVPAIQKRLVASWVEGQHFLEISEQELEGIAPSVLETQLDDFLKAVF